MNKKSQANLLRIIGGGVMIVGGLFAMGNNMKIAAGSFIVGPLLFYLADLSG